jgi:branched-chain amino acid transport system substrate-binding protein
MQRNLGRTSVSLFVLTVILAYSCPAQQQRDVSIPIRAFGALSGPVKSFGINSRAALTAASKRIDQAGGIKLSDGSIGHFDIHYDDDHCKPEDGIALLRAAAESEALAVIGPSCSSVAEPLYGTLQHKVDDANDHGAEIVLFTDGATKANLARISEWVFRNSPDEGDMYKALWKWVRVHHPEVKTVFGGEESDFAHSHSTWGNIISKEAADSGLKVLGSVGWSINDTSFAAPAEAIKNADADAVVVSAHAVTTCGVLKQLTLQNVHPKLLIGLTSASTPETLSLCAESAEGLMIPTSFIAHTPETDKEAAEVTAVGGIADLHGMAAWEILYTLKSAIEQNQIVPGTGTTSTNRRKLRDELAKLQTMKGVMGTINRTPDRESLKPFSLVRADHGRWKVLESYPAAKVPATVASTVDPNGIPHGDAKEESFPVVFEQDGLHLFLRHLPASDSKPNGKIVLFVHGATFPSGLAAAFPFGGRSWMQDLSQAGFDTWALDFIGFGGSDRYPEMSQSAEGQPLGRAEIASQQIEQAVGFILQHQGAQRVSIIAHSWGTMATGIFSGRHPELVDRLVFFAPIGGRTTRADAKVFPAWYVVSLQQQWDRFVEDVPAGEKPVLSRQDFDKWGPAYLATDAESGRRSPESVKVPSGPAQEIGEAQTGHLAYDPGLIKAPVEIVRGGWDHLVTDADAQWLFDALSASPIKRDIKIGRGTHLMHLEAMRYALYQESAAFLLGNDVAAVYAATLSK